MSFETTISTWHEFYVLAGSASATLVGLLFVGLSLHLRTVVGSSEVRGLARVTLTNFGAVLFVALFVLVPADQVTAGLQLVGTGLVSLAVATPSLVAAIHRDRQAVQMRGRDRARLIWRFGLSTVSYVAVSIAGFRLLSSPSSAFAWLLVAIVVILVIALRNTWDLLVTVGDITL